MHIAIGSGIRNFVLAAAAILLSAFFPSARAQGTPPATPSAPPIFPLSEVHRGMHATAYTVFQGSTPEAIDVEILGVLRDAIGPGKDMILARLVGAKPEFTGVVAGMSGSPVYIDGKLVGAIGFRIGHFTKQPIAGITPIQQMLNIINVSSSNNTHLMQVEIPEISPLTMVADRPFAAGNALEPIETPLAFDGFSPDAINLFEQRIPALGLTPVSGLGGASPDERDSAPVVPGSAISAIIVSGDFNMAATCTVTYVDPKRLLACGHPITRFGDISLPMTKAVVVTTIASSLDPMKVINTTQTIGSFTEDRTSGILGVFGKPAHMIPVTVAMTGIAPPHTYHFAVADHPSLTSAALIATLFQAMQDTNGYNEPSTYHATGEISLAGYPTVQIDAWTAPSTGETASLATAVLIAQRFDAIFSNPRELPVIRSVSLQFSTVAGQQSAVLADAHVLEPTVHAGDRITVETVLHPYREPQRVIRMEAQLPNTLTPGSVRLLVSGGTTLDHTLHLVADPAAPPLSLGETVARLNALHPTNRLYVTLLAPVPQASMQGRSLPAVPLTMANVLQPDAARAGLKIDGETAIPLGSKSLDLSFTGSHVITLNVQP